MECAEDVICAACGSFSLPVLHGCVGGTTNGERDTISRDEGGDVMVDELAAIVRERLHEFSVMCDEALELRYQLVLACGWMERLLIAGLNMFCWSQEGVNNVAGAGSTTW